MESTAQPSAAAVLAETPATTVRAWSARHPLSAAQCQRVRDVVLERVRGFLEQEGCEEVATPEAGPTAGPGDESASLCCHAVLGDANLEHSIRQLHLERIVASGQRRVYCASDGRYSALRAGARPAPGGGFFEVVRRDMPLRELCDFQERWLKHVAAGLHANLIGGPNATRIDRMLRGAHPRLTYREALVALNRRGFALTFGEELDRPAHAALVHYCGNLPLQVTHYPASIASLYARTDRLDSAVAERADYILPLAGETLSGLVHESDAGILGQRLRGGPFRVCLLASQGAGAIDRACVAYLEPYAHVPFERAGCGLKTGRLLQYLLGLDALPASMA